MGNSEVGHLNIGAGRVVYQDFTRIDHAIATGEFARNPVLARRRRRRPRAGGATLHVLGLLSPGGVHSHERQIAAMVELAAARRRAARPACTRSSTAATRRREAPPRRSTFMDGVCATHPRRAHRLDRRPLLRDGPRPALGARRAGLRRCWSTAARRYARRLGAGGARRRLRARRDRRVRASRRRSSRRGGRPATHGRRRRRRVHELPRRPRAAR